MAMIAIIDDNREQSDTVKINFELALKDLGSTLQVTTSFPLMDPKDYFNYIQANDIVVLILDEKLNDQAFDGSGPVDYKGTDLITILRERLKALPVFVITAFADESELVEKYGEFEEIIRREDFYAHTDKYVKRILRASNHFLNENQKELSTFTDLAAKISGGEATGDDIESFKALQTKLELPYAGLDDRSAWLEEYENQLASLRKINDLLKSQLNNNELH
jgi:hypothetical protein